MAKYKKRESNTWTLSSTALGWGAAGAVAVVVIAFGIGIYLGYGWGWEEGFVVGEEEAMEEHPDLAEQLAQYDSEAEDEFPLPEEEIPEELLFEEPDEVAEPEIDEPETVEEPEDDPEPYTEEELGLIEEPPTVTPEEPEDEPEEDPDTPEEEPEVEEEPEETVDEPDEPEEPEVTEEPEELDLFYTIQAASSQQRENAQRAREEFREMGHSVEVREATINDESWFRVRVGEFPTRRDAREYAEQMVEDGELNDYWISQVERE